MKLFYHFLFFVFASLILLACANMFTSDAQNQSQTDEYSGPESGDIAADDAAVNDRQDNPFTLTSFKSSSIVLSVSGNEDDRNCACNKNFYLYKKNSYLNSFQMAINHFSSPKKLK